MPGGRLPEDVHVALKFASGICAGGFDIEFSGIKGKFDLKEIFPFALAVAESDGNFWIVDISENGVWGRVFFVCHDPPVVVLMYESLEALVRAVLEGDRVMYRSINCASRIWREKKVGVMAKEAMYSSDMLVAKFSASLPSNFEIYDLRGEGGGNGFVWGRGGADLDCRRAGSELIFGVEHRVLVKSSVRNIFRKGR